MPRDHDNLIAWQRQMRKARRDAGLCVRCGSHSESYTCATCTSRMRRYQSDHYHRQPKERHIDRQQKVNEYKRKQRVEALDMYGGYCVCCGEDWKPYLQFDHVNDDGYIEIVPLGSEKSEPMKDDINPDDIPF